MTIKEVIVSYPGLADAPDTLIEKTLADRELSGATPYAKELSGKVELCIADMLVHMLNNPDFSEADLTISMSRGVMRQTAISFYENNGEPEKAEKLTPTIKDATNRW